MKKMEMGVEKIISIPHEGLAGIRQRQFGIEIEMTGLTRSQAAWAISNVLGGKARHVGNDKFSVPDRKGRMWDLIYGGIRKMVWHKRNG